MDNSFIKNLDLLEETHEVEDLLDFSTIQKKFRAELLQIKKSSLVGLIGAFGIGKSTMLHQLASEKVKDELWIQFDAWKYPDRSHLWEGFVLDVADQLGKRSEAAKKIDGKSAKSKIFDIATDVLSLITDKLPNLNFLDKFTELFSRSPAKRIFEIQQILKGLLEREIRRIYIVIEDIDRSGDRGIYFLETLKQFIRVSNLSNAIIAIVPINDQGFRENKASYLKSLDYTHRFETGNIDFGNFIKTIFDVNSFDPKSLWVDHLNFILKNLLDNKKATIRELKNIIRNANLKYVCLSENIRARLDIRILILFGAIKHFEDKIISRINDCYQITGNEEWIKKALIIIANNISEIKGYKVDVPIVFVNNPKLLIPNFEQDLWDEQRKQKYFLSDEYLSIYKIV